MKEISGVSKSTVFGPMGMLPHRFGQLGGFQEYNSVALAGDIIHIYYETGENQLPNSPLFFAIIDEANYTGYLMMDGKIAHSEYVVTHPQGGYIEDWNWTVPYNSNWHFIFDFRQTFRENFAVTLTRYWIGTDYVEATDYREATKTLLPSYSSYIGMGTLIIGIIVLTGSALKVKVSEIEKTVQETSLVNVL